MFATNLLQGGDASSMHGDRGHRVSSDGFGKIFEITAMSLFDALTPSEWLPELTLSRTADLQSDAFVKIVWGLGR